MLKINFNTSHVTVYLNAPIVFPARIKFQYISCYCLSIDDYRPKFAIAFQYISCYCLSMLNQMFLLQRYISIHLMLLFINTSPVNPQPKQNFNTSHVTVYLVAGLFATLYVQDFNTSHVTVYHRTIIENVHVYVFQYISCYCLSLSRLLLLRAS